MRNLGQARPAAIGRQRWRELTIRFGRELRTARITAGLTQAQLGMRAEVSQEAVSAAERGTRHPSWDVACRLAAGCGTELSIRLYPADGVSLRDSGQMRLAEEIATAAHPAWHIRLEHPVGDGSRRAHDIVMELASEIDAVEIERGFADVQGQLRAAQLKRDVLAQRSDRPVRLILAVPDTASVRRVVREHAALFARTMPIPSRRIWQAIRSGTPIGGDGILFVPPATPARPAPSTTQRATNSLIAATR